MGIDHQIWELGERFTGEYSHGQEVRVEHMPQQTVQRVLVIHIELQQIVWHSEIEGD